MLKKVVCQLAENQYKDLRDELSGHRGEKFSRLLELYRETEFEDAELKNELGANQAAFYTLKSRLFDKVQQYLFRTASDNRAELLKNISSIPFLVYNTPRETAISLLEHLETELKKLDMPAELVSVYNALKKLHIHSEQYYHYQQLYNKNVAYTLAVDKAEELVSSFMSELGEFLLSRDESKQAVLRLYLKELSNLSKLYDSHRLKVSRFIAGISYALFADPKNEIPETEETIEELLKQFQAILDEHPLDRNYRFLIYVWHFLQFEYYHRLGLHKNGAASFAKIDATLSTFILLAHSCPASHFLISKTEHLLALHKGKLPEEEIEPLLFTPDPQDAYTFINHALSAAAICFHGQKYASAASGLNQVMNEVSFKNYAFAEFQLKLFLVLTLLLAGKPEQAEVAFRSVSRKLSGSEFTDRFPAAQAFSRFLKIVINDKSAQKEKKTAQAYEAFSLVNSGAESILRFVPLQQEHLLLLGRS